MRMIKIGLVGCGNIGSYVAKHLDKSNKFKLVSILDLNKDFAVKLQKKLEKKPKIVKDISELLKGVDLIVEAASQEFIKKHALKIINHKKDLLLVSVGALVDENLLSNLEEQARKKGCKVYIPSGAICGVDGIKAAGVGKIKCVSLTTIKNPKAFAEVPFLERKGVKVEKIKKPLVLYSGSARRAVELFPKNINVSATLSLVGVGLDKTSVRIVADPKVKSNVHEVCFKGNFGESCVRLENKPSVGNFKTSYITCLSVVKVLEDMVSSVKIGT